MSGGAKVQASTNGAAHLSKRRMFIQGALVDILNPKVAIFFLAFLPQFVEPTADLVSRRLRGSATFSRRLDRVTGVVLIGLGLRLAQQER